MVMVMVMVDEWMVGWLDREDGGDVLFGVGGELKKTALQKSLPNDDSPTRRYPQCLASSQPQCLLLSNYKAVLL